MLLLKRIVSYRKNKKEENDEICGEPSFLWFLSLSRNDKRNLCQKHLGCPFFPTLHLGCCLPAIIHEIKTKRHRYWKKYESSSISFTPCCQTEGNISKVYLAIVLHTAFTRSFATCSKLEQL